MKGKIIVIIVLIFAQYVSLAQTRQEKRAISKIQIELAQLKQKATLISKNVAEDSLVRAQIATLEAKINAGDLGFEERTFSQKKVLSLKNQVKYSKSDYDALKSKERQIDARISLLEKDLVRFSEKSTVMALNEIIPQEIKRGELKRRRYSNSAESEDIQVEIEHLAVEKLVASPVIADPVNGYFGKVMNRSTNTPYNFIIRDRDSKIEVKGFAIEAGKTETYYLLPGEYEAVVYAYGVDVSQYQFHVGPQLHRVFGEDLHWSVWQYEDVKKPRPRYLK